MSVEAAIYRILSQGSSLLKPFPEIAENEKATIHSGDEQYCTYRITGITPHDTKDGVSDIDEATVDLFIFGKTHEDLVTLAGQVRDDMDRAARFSQGSIKTNGIRFVGQTTDYDTDTMRYVIEQTYEIRYHR